MEAKALVNYEYFKNLQNELEILKNNNKKTQESDNPKKENMDSKENVALDDLKDHILENQLAEQTNEAIVNKQPGPNLVENVKVKNEEKDSTLDNHHHDESISKEKEEKNNDDAHKSADGGDGNDEGEHKAHSNHTVDWLLSNIGKMKRKKIIQLLRDLNWYKNDGALDKQYVLDGTLYSVSNLKNLLETFSSNKKQKLDSVVNEEPFIKSLHKRNLDHYLTNSAKKKPHIPIKEWYHLHD